MPLPPCGNRGGVGPLRTNLLFELLHARRLGCLTHGSSSLPVDMPIWAAEPLIHMPLCPDKAISVSASTVRFGRGRLRGVLASGAVRVSGRHHIIRDNTLTRSH